MKKIQIAVKLKGRRFFYSEYRTPSYISPSVYKPTPLTKLYKPRVYKRSAQERSL